MASTTTQYNIGQWYFALDMGCYEHCIICITKREELWWCLRAPITKLLTTLAGFEVVDDTDILQTQRHGYEIIDTIVMSSKALLMCGKKHFGCQGGVRF